VVKKKGQADRSSEQISAWEVTLKLKNLRGFNYRKATLKKAWLKLKNIYI